MVKDWLCWEQGEVEDIKMIWCTDRCCKVERLLWVAGKLLTFGVITGAVGCWDCCVWLGNCLVLVYLWVLYSAENIPSGWETVGFWCICACCTVQRLLWVAGKWLAFGVLTGVVQYRDCCEWLRICLILVYLRVLNSAENVVSGWETISFGVLKSLLWVTGKLLAFGVLTGVVQCRECCEWLGNS
jgi:hypothetical protein